MIDWIVPFSLLFGSSLVRVGDFWVLWNIGRILRS